MRKRRRSVSHAVWAVAALLVGAGLTYWLVEAQPGDIEHLESRESAYEAPQPSLLTAGKTPQATPPQAAAGRAIRVRVVDAETRAPVPRAQVSLVGPTPGVATPGVDGVKWLAWGEIVSSGTTGEDGRVEIAIADDASRAGLRLAGSASGFVKAVRPWDGSAEVEVALRSGKRLAGVAVDMAGKPRAGVRIVARHLGVLEAASLPPQSLRWGLHEAVTDDAGRFVFTGLVDCPYGLDCAADGLALARTAEGGEPMCQLVYDAGTENARLVLQPVRVMAVRLLDVTGSEPVPISLAHRSLGMFLAPGDGVAGGDPLRRADDPVFDGQRWVRLARPSPDPTLFHALVRLTGARPVETAKLLLDLPTYKRSTATVRLWLPSQLRALTSVDEIRLRAADGAHGLAGTASVLVREAQPISNFFKPTWRQLALTASKNRGGTFRGRRQPDGRWLFTGLPEGRAQLSLFDGGAFSENKTVDLRGGETLELELGFCDTVPGKFRRSS